MAETPSARALPRAHRLRPDSLPGVVFHGLQDPREAVQDEWTAPTATLRLAPVPVMGISTARPISLALLASGMQVRQAVAAVLYRLISGAGHHLPGAPPERSPRQSPASSQTSTNPAPPAR